MAAVTTLAKACEDVPRKESIVENGHGEALQFASKHDLLQVSGKEPPRDRTAAVDLARAYLVQREQLEYMKEGTSGQADRLRDMQAYAAGLRTHLPKNI